MSDVLVLTNRIPDFFQKFSREVFHDVEEQHEVTYVDRDESLLGTTYRFLRAVVTTNPDLVWVAGSGFATFFVTFFGKLLPQTTVVFYHNDFTYQHMRDFKEVGTVRLTIERIQERGPLELCDVVGTMTPYHEEYLREKGIRKPFFRIEHGVHTDTFKPGIGGEKREELGFAEDDLVVGVIGTFNRSRITGVMYGWTILEALAHVDSDEIKGLFVGGGEDLDYLESRAEELGVQDRVTVTGSVPHELLPEYVSTLDVAVLVKPDHPADKMTTTMKLPEYLAAGTYLIADDHAYASTILDPERASLLQYDGIKDEAFPERMAAELDTLVEDKDRVEAGKEYSREVALERFDYEGIRADVLERVNELI